MLPSMPSSLADSRHHPAFPRCCVPVASHLRSAPQQVTRDRAAAARDCRIVAQLAAAAFGVAYGEIIGANRGERRVAFARQSAMYLAHVAFGLSYSEVGRAFGRDRTTAAHACCHVEDRRDNPEIDALLGSLEGACRILRRRFVLRVQP